MSVKPAFEAELVTIQIADIIPIKTVTPAYRKSEIYRRIAASIVHVGIIEPLVVFPTQKGKYLLLDGHTRLDILVTTNVTSTDCLIATDNESYTYDRRVNHIPPIAQHHMILRALAHVSEERIAFALDVKVSAIREKRDLLNGIYPETAQILHDERISAAAFAALRKMKAVRQIEVARLMIAAKNFTGHFARALLDGTREELLIPLLKGKPRTATLTEQTMLERETEDLLKNVKSIQENYGNDARSLIASGRYVERLLANPRVRRYLEKRHGDTLAAMEQLLADIAGDKRRRPAQKVSASQKKAASL